MEEPIKQQIIEGRIWIGDCSWRDEPEDLEDLTDDEVIRGINWYYDGGWIQFTEDYQYLQIKNVSTFNLNVSTFNLNV